MDLDVIYKIPKDLCWQDIKSVVRPDCISLALYRACVDPYITKKTIRNTISRLKHNGLFAIECEPEHITNVINLSEELGYEYIVVNYVPLSDDEYTLTTYVIYYKNELVQPKISTLIRINTWNDVSYSLANLTSYQDIILCIGDGVLQHVPIIKHLGRYVIAMGDDQLLNLRCVKEGLRHVSL